MNHFEVFGLERRLGIDAEALQRRFYELSRRYHPDFHAGATPTEQAEALAASARLNAAYRTLRDPIARIDYLVRLEEGRETKEGALEQVVRQGAGHRSSGGLGLRCNSGALESIR